MASRLSKLSNEELETYLNSTKLLGSMVATGEITIEKQQHSFEIAQRELQFMGLMTTSAENATALHAILKGEKQAFVPVHLPMASCWTCGEFLDFETNGKIIRPISVCDFPRREFHEFTLNVPSGKMVVGNDFRDGFRIIGDFNVNTTKGVVATIDAYAAVGLAHAYVGNTCPGVYRYDNKHFVIGSSSGKSPAKGARRVAGICTDLWWYSIADYDEWVRRYGKEPGNDENVIKCEPGVYKFRHYLSPDRTDWRKPVVWAKITRLRKPAPVKDYKSEYDQLNYTAEEIIGNHVGKDEEDGYLNIRAGGNSEKRRIMAAADQLMCVLGNGADMHPNGWLNDRPNVDRSLAVEIPEFNEPFRWYGFGDYCMLASVANIGKPMVRAEMDAPLNESFTKLAFNILRCAILFPYPFEREEEKKREEYSLKWAKKIIVALAKKYPDRVPDNCKELIASLKKRKRTCKTS
jgi:hypothetical protein